MTVVIESVFALAAIGSSLVIYFSFIDRSLDKVLDRVFAGWRAEMEEREE